MFPRFSRKRVLYFVFSIFFHRLQRDAERSRKTRFEKLERIENEATASELKGFNRKVTGRPRKEVDQPELLSTIVQVVEASTAAHSELDLHSELIRLWYNLSCSATYLRLLSRRSDSREESAMFRLSRLNWFDQKTHCVKKILIACLQNHSWMICSKCANCLGLNQCLFFQSMIKLE